MVLDVSAKLDGIFLTIILTGIKSAFSSTKHRHHNRLIAMLKCWNHKFIVQSFPRLTSHMQSPLKRIISNECKKKCLQWNDQNVNSYDFNELFMNVSYFGIKYPIKS